MTKQLTMLARNLTGWIVFQKKLPKDFQRQKIFVTTRSDMRLLAPGLERAGGDLFNVVRNYVQPGNVVWDIGSNLGILSFSAAMKVGPKGKVFSLEADPRYADIQGRTSRKLPQDVGKVTVLSAAVADKFGLLDLIIPKKGHTRNHLSVVDGNSAGDPETSKQVVTLTLDYLLDYWCAPNFVKIDVEGAEALAISGADRLFTEVRPVSYIECSPDNSAFLTKFFKERNYSLFSLDKSFREKQLDEFVFNTLVKPN